MTAGTHSTSTAAPTREPSADLSIPDGAAAPAELSRAELRRRLLAVGRPVLAPLVLSTVFRTLALLLGIALLAVAAWGVGAVAQHLTGARAAAPIGAVVAVMVVLSLVKGLLRYLEQFCGHLVAFRALALLRTYFYDRLEPQAPAAVEGRRTGDLLSRVTKDVDRVEVFFAHTLAPAVTAVVVPVLTLGYLAVAVDPLTAVLLAPFLLLVGWAVPMWGRRATGEASGRLRSTRGEIAQHVTDSVQGVREVLAFSYAPGRMAELGRLDERSGRALKDIGGWIALRRGANTALMALGLVAQLLVVSGQVDAGAMTWQQAAVALAITAGAFAPVLAVEDFSADLEQAYASARRIFEVTDAAPLVPEPAQPRTLEVRAGTAPEVVFDGVTFAYPIGPEASGARPDDAVRDITLTLTPGTTTALVGSSGSGKSTLSSLLVRFWDADAGAMRIGGVDVRDLGLDELRSVVAVAQQRPYLFNDTIEANLRMARPEASAEEIAVACRRAALDEVVAGLPDGMETVVGEMGERLSGGQRQRLAVARALLRESSVLVLDEATSQLDAVSEARVLAGVREAAQGRTVLVIAHRLSTIADADQIVVLDAGRVVEQGTHAELVSADGAYARLLDREAESLDGAV